MPSNPASKTHVFPGVTLQALTRLRGQGGANAALKLDPDGAGGLLTIATGMGDVIVRFSHDNEHAELTLSIVKKPMFLPASLIFEQTSQVLRRAAGSAHTTETAAIKPVGPS